MMRKLLVIVLIAALSLTMLTFLAGCGGSDANTEDAKSYMSTGDGYMDSAEMDWIALDEMQADLATQIMGGDLTAVTGEAGEALQQEFEVAFDGLSSALDSAKAEYEKIRALDGVQDYKDYASKMIEAINVYENALDSAIKLADDFQAALAAMAAGEDIDFVTMMMENEDLALVSELRGQGDDLVDEAKQIQQDKKLAE